MEMHRPSWDHVLKSRVTWIVFLRKELSYSVGCSFLFITLFIQRLSCFSWSLFRSKPVMISLLCPFFTHFSSLVLTLQKHEKMSSTTKNNTRRVGSCSCHGWYRFWWQPYLMCLSASPSSLLNTLWVSNIIHPTYFVFIMCVPALLSSSFNLF